jgi:hypothetical protein
MENAMASFAYLRLDTRKFAGTGPAGLKSAKAYYADIFRSEDPNITLVDEDPSNIGDNPNSPDPKKYGVTYHTRPYLETLMAQNLGNINGAGGHTRKITGAPAASTGDTIFIYNLSHLSADPHVMGTIVSIFLSKLCPNNIHLHLLSIDQSTKDIVAGNPQDWFFRGIAALGGLPPAPAVLRKTRLHICDGGGDGGGNGGC